MARRVSESILPVGILKIFLTVLLLILKTSLNMALVSVSPYCFIVLVLCAIGPSVFSPQYRRVCRTPKQVNCQTAYMKVYIERNTIQVELIRLRNKMATLLMLETLNWEYAFAIGVFTKLGSLLSVRSRHCSVQGAPDVSRHDLFGARHFGTY